MANSLDAFVPELWANESVAILEENMVAANLVHRDFEDQLQEFGDVVNTRQPAEFSAKRKVDSDNVTDQDASATNIPVTLDQHVHVSYVIKDGEQSKSFKNLVKEYIHPAALAMARFTDQVVLGQVYQFLANQAGLLGGGSDTTIKGYMLDAREVMNRNKAYMTGRNLIVTPDAETEMLKVELFTAADKVGDAGTALREASLGRRLGWDIYMCQNCPEIATGNTTEITLLVNNASGYGAGTVTMTVDGLTGAVTTGQFFTLVADGAPHMITAHTETLGNTTSITFSPPLLRAVANNDVITRYVPGAINLGAGYAAGWAKPMVIDGFTVAPKVGQMVTLGVTAANLTKYSVIEASTTSILLDKPLAFAVADNDLVNIGPAGAVGAPVSTTGSYNFGFHRNALALVMRPLATPMPGTGAVSGRSNYKGAPMRVTFTYDGLSQGLRVTHDFLCGIKVLDTDLGVVMYS